MKQPPLFPDRRLQDGPAEHLEQPAAQLGRARGSVRVDRKVEGAVALDRDLARRRSGGGPGSRRRRRRGIGGSGRRRGSGNGG